MTERDREGGERDANEDEREDSDPEASEADESAGSDAPASARTRDSARAAVASKGHDRGATKSTAPPISGGARTALIAIVGLAAGVAAGWFGHDARAKAKLRADSAPAAVGSGAASGPCGAWEKKICASGGDESAACQQAKAATGLLTPSTCEAALETVPATLAKVKAGRVPCENLTTKLCAEVPQGSGTCGMVKQRITSLPGDRCEDMLKNYDQVAMQIRMIEQQTGGQMGGGMPHPGMQGHGGPPGAAPPPGAPPGAAPPPGSPGPSPH